MNGPQLELGACERVTLGLRRLLDPGGGIEQEALAAHARGCPDCGTLLVVAREVSSGVAAARAAVDAVEPRSYVRDFTRLLQRALDEHRRELAELFHEIGKAYVYETSAERLKIVTPRPPGEPLVLREQAKRAFESAARLAPTPPRWTVEGELLRLVEYADPESRLYAAGRFLESALRFEPGHEPATTWLAAQREATGDLTTAEDLYLRLSRESLDETWRSRAFFNLARFRCREKDYAGALSLTVLGRELDPLHPVSYPNLALYAFYAGQLELVATSVAQLHGLVSNRAERLRLLRFTILSPETRTRAVRRQHRNWFRSLCREFPDLVSDAIRDCAVRAHGSVGASGQGKEKRTRIVSVP